MFETKRRVAVLTGATGGIGEAITVSLSGKNLVCILLGKDEGKLRKLKEKTKANSEIVTYCGNLMDVNFIEKVTRTIRKDYGKVDILINNAASFYVEKIGSFPIEKFDEIISVNLRANFLMVKNFLPLFKKSHSAHIINIASISAHHGWEKGGPYCASKFAIIGLSQSLRKELAMGNIRVSIISPGQVDTKMSVSPLKHPGRKNMLKPEDVASLVSYTVDLPDNVYIEEAIIRPLGL